MKHTVIAIAALALSASSVFAQTTVQNGSNSTSTSGSQSGAQAVIQQNYGKGHKTAASAIAPGLAASGLSCSGSAAVGGAGGGWGISLGITTSDESCNTREDAKYIQGVTGDVGAAKERLCDNAKTRAAFARAGRPCAGDMPKVAGAGIKPLRMTMTECRKLQRKNPTLTCRPAN